MLLLCLVLLGACGGEQSGQSVSSANAPTIATGGPENTAASPSSKATSTIGLTTTTADDEAECMDVKSKSLYPGFFLNKYMCLEGTATSTQLSSVDKTALINLDTNSGKSGGTLYTIQIYISDRFAYGLENIDKVFKGARVKVRGIFLEERVGKYSVKISRPDEIELVL